MVGKFLGVFQLVFLEKLSLNLTVMKERNEGLCHLRGCSPILPSFFNTITPALFPGCKKYHHLIYILSFIPGILPAEDYFFSPGVEVFAHCNSTIVHVILPILHLKPQILMFISLPNQSQNLRATLWASFRPYTWLLIQVLFPVNFLLLFVSPFPYSFFILSQCPSSGP